METFKAAAVLVWAVVPWALLIVGAVTGVAALPYIAVAVLGGLVALQAYRRQVARREREAGR